MSNQEEHMSIEEAAKHLSTALGEPFDEAEVLNLALNGRLRLSIFFQSHTLAECSVVSDTPSPFARKSVKLKHGYRLFEEHPRHISGLWDLPLLGAGSDQAIEGGRAYVEQRYRELSGEPVPPRSGACGAYVDRPDGTQCELVEKYDPNKFPDESKPFPQPVEYLPTDGFPDDAVLRVREDALNKYLQDRTSASQACKVKYSEYSRKSLWMVYEGMFLLLGQRPMIGYVGTKPQFGWIVERCVERHRREKTTARRFSDGFFRLGRDIEDDLALGKFPVIPADNDNELQEHDWPTHRLFGDDWYKRTRGFYGDEPWEPIPRDRIGVDVCLKRCRPADFLRWAKSRGYDIPEELRLLLEEGETGEITTEQRNSTSQDRENPLAVFREMENLRFDEIDICLDPETLSLTIRAREKEKRRVPLHALGLTRENGVTLTEQGKAFFDMAEEGYTTQRHVRERLSKALRNAFSTEDTPISKGKPRFKLRIPKDAAAKYWAERNPASYDDTAGYTHEPEGDAADEWLRNNDKA